MSETRKTPMPPTAIDLADQATIHVAHSVSRKGGMTSYRAVAVVTNEGKPGFHTHRVSLDDTASEAEANAVRYIKETYHRDGLIPPSNFVSHGRKRNIDIETLSFLPL